MDTSESKTAFQYVAAAVWRRGRMLRDIGVATLVINLVALLISLYTLQVYDRVIPRGGFETLFVLTLGIGIALFIDFLLKISRAFIMDRESGDIDVELSEFFFARLLAVGLDARPPSVGTLAAQLRGLDIVRGLMTSASFLILADLPFALLFIAAIAGIGGSVALVPLTVFPIALITAFIFAALIRRDAEKVQLSSHRKNGLLVDSINASETIRSNSAENHLVGRWNKLLQELQVSDRNLRRWSVIAGALFSLLQQVSFVGIVVVGAFQVADGNLTLGGLIACTILGGRINGPLVASLPNLIIQWTSSRIALTSLDQMLQLPSAFPIGKKAIAPPEGAPNLLMQNVTFAYNETSQALQVQKFKLEPGERVAIIGSVGSGKTTFLKLLAGLYQPKQGEVLFSDVDMRLLDETAVRRKVFYMPQHYQLFQGTLRENLLAGLSAVDDEKVLEAAKRSGLIKVINGHPRGLELPIAEGGQGLSGGQTALVGITRLFLSDADILLLDEPSSALDQETEARVINELFKYAGDRRSVVMITHRPQVFTAIRRLVVFGQGRIAIDGPLKDVLARLRETATRPTTEAPDA